MISPSDILNSYNFSGQLSLPPFTPYSLLTLNNLPNNVFIQTPDNGAHNVIPVGDAYGHDQLNPHATGKPQTLDQIQSILGVDFQGFFAGLFKNYMLLMLALALIVLGLYMLANSTDTGKQIIAVGKDTAIKAAVA